jgi:hypothetical protein
MRAFVDSPPLLAEKVALRRHDELPRGALAGDVEAADDRGGHARELAHDELGRARDLVGDGDHRRVQLVADAVAPAA